MQSEENTQGSPAEPVEGGIELFIKLKRQATEIRHQARVQSLCGSIRSVDVDVEILKCLAEGLNTKEIGPLLFRSPRTIESRIAALKELFNCSTRDHLVATALRKKIIE